MNLILTQDQGADVCLTLTIGIVQFESVKATAKMQLQLLNNEELTQATQQELDEIDNKIKNLWEILETMCTQLEFDFAEYKKAIEAEIEDLKIKIEGLKTDLDATNIDRAEV